MPFQTPSLLIGVSARIYYPSGPVLDLGGVWTKTLHYLEQSVAHWLIAGGALPVLQGGNDVAPQTYGQSPLEPAWAGDAVRDTYEMALIRAFVDAGKPVFGICRGLQMLNVAFGGTLWQDIKTQQPQALEHIKTDLYEHNTHPIEILPNTHLASLYPALRHARINSIHHQAIRELAGVQWHPEFRPKNESATFDDTPLLQDFLESARALKEAKTYITTESQHAIR